MIVAGSQPCPTCGGRIRSAEGPRGKFLSCERFPRCNWTAGGDALTLTRMRTHRLFDRIWKDRIMSRVNAYRLLRDTLQLTEEQAHISRLSITQCHTLIEALKKIGLVEAKG